MTEGPRALVASIVTLVLLLILGGLTAAVLLHPETAARIAVFLALVSGVTVGVVIVWNKIFSALEEWNIRRTK